MRLRRRETHAKTQRRKGKKRVGLGRMAHPTRIASIISPNRRDIKSRAFLVLPAIIAFFVIILFFPLRLCVSFSSPYPLMSSFANAPGRLHLTVWLAYFLSAKISRLVRVGVRLDPAGAHARQLKSLGLSGEDLSRRDLMKVAQYEVLGNDAKRHVRPARDDRNVRR